MKELMKAYNKNGASVVKPSAASPYHLAGWINPGDEMTLKNYQPNKSFKYDLSYRDEKGKKYFTRGTVVAHDVETARLMVEYMPKALGMKKIWVCIFVFKKMEIYDGNGM
jgi:hypothetical protein